jgi:hypothetical protein
MKTLGKGSYTMAGIALIGAILLFFGQAAAQSVQSVPKGLKTITAEDGSVVEQVNEPGFGNPNNIGIDGLCLYKGSLYALTRNDVSGFELWKTRGAAWKKLAIPGFTDSPYHHLMQGGYGDIIEFKDHLYVATSSGYEGAFFYQGIGCEIWRFDGRQWEPVISYSRDIDDAGTISALSGCSADDGDTTALVTVSGKNWAADQWKGGGLLITSGEGSGRYFAIVGNTVNTLTIQEIEAGSFAGIAVQYTICGEHAPDPKVSKSTVGAVIAGDSYQITMGLDENGFGDPWNKSAMDLEVLNDELFVTIGHNYEYGGNVWKTGDGLNWERDSAYSFGNYHGYDLDGNLTGFCPNAGQENTIGNRVCTSATLLGKSDVSGTTTLYTGASGANGCNGRGARVLRRDDDKWRFIVDYFVDDNDIGTNENGIGNDGGGNALKYNIQAWDWANYDQKLFTSVPRLLGGGMAYTNTGGEEDGAWKYVVGGDSVMPTGFDGVSGPMAFSANIGSHIYAFDSALYAGSFKVYLYENPTPNDPLPDGADIWRATGPADALVWARVTSNGFGNDDIINFESFCTFHNDMYVAGSNYFGKNLDAALPPGPGARIFRFKKRPAIANISSLTAAPDRDLITLNWETAAEPKCTGFNVLRSTSEKENRPYEKLNSEIIAATGSKASGGTYTFTDNGLESDTTYYYKVESVSSSGKKTSVGPLTVKTN